MAATNLVFVSDGMGHSLDSASNFAQWRHYMTGAGVLADKAQQIIGDAVEGTGIQWVVGWVATEGPLVGLFTELLNATADDKDRQKRWCDKLRVQLSRVACPEGFCLTVKQKSKALKRPHLLVKAKGQKTGDTVDRALARLIGVYGIDDVADAILKIDDLKAAMVAALESK